MPAVIQMDAAVVRPRTLPFLDDDPRAEEADAGHDSLRHARRVETGIARRAHPVILVHRHQHQQRRCQAHEHVGAQTGGAAVERAFVPDERAGRERGQQAQDHLVVIGAQLERHAASSLAG